MLPQKRMQVFVSSTFADLQKERQAAVEAILTAGHIPAGMELFAAGDESQMDVIRQWIDESDVFLLILGFRYGSIEPRTGKSYIQLEYEYAAEAGKPFFAVVIDESLREGRVRELGTRAIETENAAALREFRAAVTSKMVRFWRDTADIKLAILEKLLELSRRETIEGWVRASNVVNVGPLAEEVARLSRENKTLQDQLSTRAVVPTTYNGLTFDELQDLLTHTPIPRGFESHRQKLEAIANVFGDAEPTLLHVLWFLSGMIAHGRSFDLEYLAAAAKLEEFGLIAKSLSTLGGRVFSHTAAGQQFLLRLRQARKISIAEELRL